ncbi:hypothetical protein ACFL6C_04880 [Myxococcota bacterium]
METYYELEPDIFGKYVPKITSDLGEGIRFKSGSLIQGQVPSPIVFATNHSAADPPKGMHGRIVPVMSDELIGALQQAGVSNLQCFAAELRSNIDGTVWNNYQAVNVIGLIACADLDRSEYTGIIDRPGEWSLPLMAFEDLKIDPARSRDALLFRLAEDPTVIIVAGGVVESLLAQKSDDAWGITLDET